MAYPLETSFDTSGDNIQRRELYSMDEFAGSEPPGSLIWVLFKCWKALDHGGRTPLAQDVLTDNSSIMRLDGYTSLIDVSDPNPWNFLFVAHCHTPYLRLGSELNDTRVSQFPCAMHAKALMAEYFMARETAKPVYHEIEQMIFGLSRHYRRLILPLADTRRKITKLVVAVRSIRPPVQLAPVPEKILMN